MTDITTHSEEDTEMLTKLAQYVDRVRNTIINASELAKEVQNLRDQVAQITTEMHSKVEEFNREIADLRQANAWADETLQRVRQERDEAQERANDLFAQLSAKTDQHASAVRDVQYWQEQHNSLTAVHESVKRERDDAHYKVMELEDENKALKAKLEAIEAMFKPKVPHYEVQPRTETGQFQPIPEAAKTGTGGW